MTNSKNNKKKQLILIRGLLNKLDNGIYTKYYK